MTQGNVALDLQRFNFSTSLSIQSATLTEGPVEGAILFRYFYSQLDATPLGVTHKLAISKHPCYSDIGSTLRTACGILAAEPRNPCTILQSLHGGENRLSKAALWSPLVHCMHACPCARTYTKEINEWINNVIIKRSWYSLLWPVYEMVLRPWIVMNWKQKVKINKYLNCYSPSGQPYLSWFTVSILLFSDSYG